jgi:RNA polymerase sigma-70 factor (ECF subfamily)
MRSRESTWQEARLREAVLEGDETAWRILYERSFRSLYAFVRCRVRGGDEAAREIVQETWMIAVRRSRSFSPERSSFETWLRGIAANAIRNHRRREGRRATAPLPEPDALPGSGEPAPGERGARKETVERILRVLTLLPARYRSILRARYRDGLSVAAIAESLGESRKAVESRISRARSAFRATYARLERGNEEI